MTTDTRPPLSTRGVLRTKQRHESVRHVRLTMERLDQALAEHDLLCDSGASPQSRAEFNRMVGLAARLGAAVDAWSGA